MNKALNLISLAQKAGKVKAGEYLTVKALKEGFAHLVIVASDTSEKSKARIAKECDIYGGKFVVYGNKSDLGHFIGSREKSVICLTDEGFSDALLKLIEKV